MTKAKRKKQPTAKELDSYIAGRQVGYESGVENERKLCIYAICSLCKNGVEVRREPDIPAWLHYHNGEPSAACPAGPIHESQHRSKP